MWIVRLARRAARTNVRINWTDRKDLRTKADTLTELGWLPATSSSSQVESPLAGSTVLRPGLCHGSGRIVARRSLFGLEKPDSPPGNREHYINPRCPRGRCDLFEPLARR
jgi:hypothetical protein